mgnify:CR=1 FL=1
MEVLYLRDRDKSLFARYENALSDDARYADIWNSIWIKGASDISDNYDKRVYLEYPLLERLMANRVKAYLDVENGKYLSEEFSTERLSLKRFDVVAKDALIDIVKNDESFKFFNQTGLSNDALLESATRELNYYAIWKNASIIGVLVVNTIELADSWTIAYYIVPSARNNGYAKEALYGAIDMIRKHKIFHLQQTDLDDVFIRAFNCKCLKAFMVDCNNVASIKLLKSIGFSLEEDMGNKKVYKMII